MIHNGGFSSVSALKFLKENVVGAFKRAKHAQRRTIGIKIWLYTHPRNFGCDKIVRPSLPPYVYLMLSKKEILFKVFILRGFKRVYYRSKPTISCTDSTWIQEIQLQHKESIAKCWGVTVQKSSWQYFCLYLKKYRLNQRKKKEK